jgi:manganese-dependent inorganic pyrophosphatase
MPLYVFGHRNPDTDAICAAIAYADFLQRTRRPDAIAACCGAPNQRTEFALRKAGLSAPRIIMDVRPEVEDVCRRLHAKVRCTDVFYDVYRALHAEELRAVPVLDPEDHVVGVVNLLDLLELVFQGGVDPIESRQERSSLNKIVAVLGGSFQHAVDCDQTDELIVTVGAMSAGGFCERLEHFPAEKLLVVCGDRPTIQVPALEMGVRGLVVTGGYELSAGLLQLAQAQGVTVINSPYDTATTTMRIKAARTIESAVRTDFVSLPAKMPVAAAHQQVSRSAQPIFPVVEGGKLVGVLSRSDLLNPPKPELVLVDHNEMSQAVLGAEEARILEVLDHHRLGASLRTTDPIRLNMEPVGSTCTLVARQFRDAGLEPTPGIALCMAAGMISDTLHLRSPTTTDVDRECLEWLQGCCQVDLVDFAQEFFQVGSALRTCSPEEVVREDCKEFSEAGQRFSISQIEEIGFDLFWQRQDELAQALGDLATSKGYDFSALLVTDISSNGSLLLMSREPPGWEEINYPQLEDRLYKLEQVVSRKKQLLPLICNLLGNASVLDAG